MASTTATTTTTVSPPSSSRRRRSSVIATVKLTRRGSFRAVKVKTGQRLYDDLVKRNAAATATDADLIDVAPVDCLTKCDASNVVALAAPGKYSYQFAGLREGDSATLDDLLSFARDWAVDKNANQGFTKSKMRPRALKATCVARIPPVVIPPPPPPAMQLLPSVQWLATSPTGSISHGSSPHHRESMERVRAWRDQASLASTPS